MSASATKSPSTGGNCTIFTTGATNQGQVPVPAKKTVAHVHPICHPAPPVTNGSSSSPPQKPVPPARTAMKPSSGIANGHPPPVPPKPDSLAARTTPSPQQLRKRLPPEPPSRRPVAASPVSNFSDSSKRSMLEEAEMTLQRVQEMIEPSKPPKETAVESGLNKQEPALISPSLLNQATRRVKLVPGYKSVHATDEPVDPEQLEIQKCELIDRLTQKIAVLRSALQDVEQEIKVNEDIGALLLQTVKQSKAPPAQKDRYERHVEEVGRVVNLQLKLQEQLSRIECAIRDAEQMNDQKEKEALEERKTRVRTQLQDAEALRGGILSKSGSIKAMFQQFLPSEKLNEYTCFIRTKEQLLVDQRAIEDKIKLGDEQLDELKKSLQPASRET